MYNPKINSNFAAKKFVSMKKYLFLLVSLVIVAATSSAKSFTIVFGNEEDLPVEFYETESASTVISQGLQYVTATPFLQCQNAYIGDVPDAVRLGTSDKTHGEGILEIALAKKDTVTTIVVNGRLYNENKAATLNVNKAGAQDLTKNNTNLTYEINSAIQSILLETSRYAYINSITVNTGKIDTVFISKIELKTDNKDIIMVGNSTKIYVTLTPSNATVKQLKWTSSDTKIATVNEQGIVTGVAPGKVTITATAQDGTGVSATYAITVIPYEVLKVTCQQAFLIAQDLWEEEFTDEVYEISGYITDIYDTYVDDNGRQTFYMADSPNGGHVVRAKKPLVPVGYTRFQTGMRVLLIGPMTCYWEQDASHYVAMVERGEVQILEPTDCTPIVTRSNNSKYIENGQLIIVHEGVRFNAQGLRID